MRVSNMTSGDLIAFEKKVAKLWEAGKIKRPVHLSGGNEGKLIKIFRKIKEEDYVFSTHRNHYHALLSGIMHDRLLADITTGVGGSMCVIDHSKHFYSSAIVSGLVATAAGVAHALQRAGKNNHVWCFIGDGATDEGAFYEAHRYATGYDLPITFVIEDNNRSVETPDMVRWGFSTAKHAFQDCKEKEDRIIYYSYEPTRPHVGTGNYVHF